MKIGIYDRYWRTLGGGEQFAGGIAQALSEEHDVQLLGPDPVDIGQLRERLGLDLSRTAHRFVTDDNSISAASADYDLFVNCTYLSPVVNRSRHGLYVVHFPGMPPTAVDRARHVGRSSVARLLAVAPKLPLRLQRVRNDWMPSSDGTQPARFLASYSQVVANSEFTARWIQRLWDMRAEVLYPPVQLRTSTRAAAERQPIILSVGRFIDRRIGHCKKQLELVHAFRALHDSGRAPGWELHLVGGCEPANREYAMSVKKAAAGYPIHVRLNAPGATLADLFDSASIFWHGAGLDEDEEQRPDLFEHFGIGVVEAMSAGLAPVVYGAAGPAELVRDGIDGLHFRTIDQLVRATAGLVDDAEGRHRMAASSVQKAQEFGYPSFAVRMRALAASVTG